MTKNNKTILMIVGVLVLIAGTAAGSAYLTKESVTAEKTATTKTVTTTRANNPAPAPARPQQAACDDGNIAGKVVGGVGGGVVGSMIGKGGGKTAATIGGTLGGAYVGGEVLPMRNVTCAR